MSDLPVAWKRGGDFVFVSYSHRDSLAVHRQIRNLQDAEVHVYYDEGIEPGADWPDELANAIAECSCFLVFLSANSLASRNVRNEINFAISKGRKILAVYLTPCSLPPGLALQMGTVQAIPMHQLSQERFLEKLLTCLEVQSPSPPKALPAGKRHMPIKVAAAVLALVAFFLGAFFLLFHQPRDLASLSFFGTPPTPGEVSADLRLVLEKSDGTIGPLEDGASVSPKDGYRIEGTVGTKGWLYIYQVDSSGATAWLFPKNPTTSFSQGQNPVGPAQAVRLPAAGNFFLDDIPGLEHMTIVFSAAPWKELEERLLKEAASQKTPPSKPMGFTTRGVAGIREDSPGVSPSTLLNSDKEGVIAKQIWFHHTARPGD